MSIVQRKHSSLHAVAAQRTAPAPPGARHWRYAPIRPHQDPEYPSQASTPPVSRRHLASEFHYYRYLSSATWIGYSLYRGQESCAPTHADLTTAQALTFFAMTNPQIACLIDLFSRSHETLLAPLNFDSRALECMALIPLFLPGTKSLRLIVRQQRHQIPQQLCRQCISR